MPKLLLPPCPNPAIKPAPQYSKDLVDNLLFLSWVLKDIEQRSGGNPFDNRNTIYTGTANDNALNDGVKRYAADQGALTYL